MSRRRHRLEVIHDNILVVAALMAAIAAAAVALPLLRAPAEPLLGAVLAGRW